MTTPGKQYRGRRHTCPRWLCFTFDNFLRRLYQNPRAILGPLVSEGQTVLDLGPGIGFFTLPLAEMVGEAGLVIAADIQPAMLAAVAKRASRKGCADRIRLHHSARDAVGVGGPVDVILMFWMLHEVEDQGRLLRELRGAIRPGGRVLLVEPKLHVKAGAFEASLERAREAGFEVLDRPRVALSRAALLAPAEAPPSSR